MTHCTGPLYNAGEFAWKCVEWGGGGVGGEADSQQHLADRNSDASSSCMCKSTPPSAPLAPPIGPGIVPTALFRQECLLAPQRETEKERERLVKFYSIVWSVAPPLSYDFPLSLVLQRK